ncbi:pre-mRNA-splicing factor ISY1 homolog, partial [Saccoglossus kowalevskii]
MKNIDADYYGYRDEDDGVLVPLEMEYEKKLIAERVGDWKSQKEALLSGDTGMKDVEEEEEDIYAVAPEPD